MAVAACAGGFAFAAAGEVIGSFVLAGQPALGVRGLASDWADGNIWAAALHSYGDVRVAKFDATSHVLLTSWTPLAGAATALRWYNVNTVILFVSRIVNVSAFAVQ